MTILNLQWFLTFSRARPYHDMVALNERPERATPPQTLNDRYFSLECQIWAYNISLESSWSLVSNAINVVLIRFFYKKLCSKDWTCIKFQHKQTLNDRHFSLGYQNWAYNISLERSWSLDSNAINIAIIWFFYLKL